MNYPWTKKEEALLVDMVNAASEKYAGRINWREMKEIGNHTIASSQTRWSRNLKPLHIWNGKTLRFKQSKHIDRGNPCRKARKWQGDPSNQACEDVTLLSLGCY
jgi:hypothetical protein